MRVPWDRALVFVGEAAAPGCRHAALGTVLCPCTSSGRRLERLLGEPLQERCGALNLCDGAWDDHLARTVASSLRLRARIRAKFHEARPGKYGPVPRFVLLGARVRDAFAAGEGRPKMVEAPFWWGADGGFRYALMPHPSGRCREWNLGAPLRRMAEDFLRDALRGAP